MSDLQRRLLDDPELSPMARALLRSAEGDGPSAESRQAVARGLGIAAGGAVLAVSGGAAAWWAVPVLAVALATAGAVGYGVASAPSGSVGEVTRARPQRIADEASAMSGIGTSPDARMPDEIVAEVAVAPPVPVPVPDLPAVAAAPRQRLQPRRAAPAIVAAEPAAATVPEPAPIAEPVAIVEAESPPAPVTTPDPVPTITDPRRLAAEVALLDRARRHLAKGDAGAALAAIAERARDFPGGLLAAEAELVRIEALLRQGKRDDAARVGRQFLQRFPRSPLAQRVRSLVAPGGATP